MTLNVSLADGESGKPAQDRCRDASAKRGGEIVEGDRKGERQAIVPGLINELVPFDVMRMDQQKRVGNPPQWSYVAPSYPPDAYLEQ